MLQVLKDGMPTRVRIYDNLGASLDRYTVVFTGNYLGETGGRYWSIIMDGNPTFPGGICSHSTDSVILDKANGAIVPRIGFCHKHLGLRISFEDLQEGCREVVMRDYCNLWDVFI